MPILKSSAATDKGLRRGNNEDCYLSLPERGLWAVADGMGGHEAGEVASAIVRDTLAEVNPSERTLADVIQASHQAVLNAVEQGVGAPGMGSTVVALKSDNLGYEVAWVGDSRAYLWTPDDEGGYLQQLTTDHSYVQRLLASGAINAEEVDSHPDKNVITQCLGSPELAQVAVDSVTGKWHNTQWILLCSDGLTDEVSDEDIAHILCEAEAPNDGVDRLIRRALENGGSDNVTVQIVESPKAGQNRSNPTSNGREPPLPAIPWLPSITGTPLLDRLLYGAVTLLLVLLIYWL